MTGRHGTAGVAPAAESVHLTCAEANPLVAALVCRLADDLGIRALVIKGLSLAHHGLRTDRVSADVDVLVEPTRFEELLAAILGVGWTLRPTSTGDRLMIRHSVTLLHRAWPNDIDLHSTFPGLLAGPGAAFEELWRHRTRVVLGGVPCWIPDRASALVIWGLHSLRGNVRQPRHDAELDQLTAVLPGLSAREREDLAERVVGLGADLPLREVPEFAGITGDRHGIADEVALAEWRSKVATAKEVSPWLQVLRETPPLRRPCVLWQAVWPSREDLLVLDPSARDTVLGRGQARVRRFGRVIARALERVR